jgi:hypothetical protein
MHHNKTRLFILLAIAICGCSAPETSSNRHISRAVRVAIAGWVRNPHYYVVDSEATIAALIKTAGGFFPDKEADGPPALMRLSRTVDGHPTVVVVRARDWKRTDLDFYPLRNGDFVNFQYPPF